MDALVAAAIHDAKNALMVLDQQLADMQSGASQSAANADILPARAAVARIAGQLTELLTLYRAQGGQLRLAIDDHDLTNFVADLVAELGPTPANITLTIDRKAAERIGAWAFDAFLVKLALLDALRNALRHARAQVSFAFETQPHGGICFSVSDDGPGYPELMLIGAHVQSNNASTGLGLTFARLIADRHATPSGRHGHVELANTPGATLRIFLP